MWDILLDGLRQLLFIIAVSTVVFTAWFFWAVWKLGPYLP